MADFKYACGSNHRGMSRGDLVVMLIVVAVLGFLFFTTIDWQRGRGPQRAMCLNNIRQIILAGHNYQSSNLKFPCASGGVKDEFGASFLVNLLPFLDQQNIADQYRDDFEIKSHFDALTTASENRLDAILCANASRKNAVNLSGVESSMFASHYMASCGPNSDPDNLGYHYAQLRQEIEQTVGLDGVFSPHSSDPANPIVAPEFHHKHGKTFEDIKDGASNTIAIVESSQDEDRKNRILNLRNGWAMGHSVDSDSQKSIRLFSGVSIGMTANPGPMIPYWGNQPISSNHQGGAIVAMADGSVRFVSDDISVEVLRAASSIADGQNDVME